MATPESIVTAACVNWAVSQGWRPDRNHVGTFYTSYGGTVAIGRKGQPDWRFLKGNPDRYFECEFKAAGKKPRKDQLEYMAILKHLGIKVFWADSLESFKLQVAQFFD